MKVVCDVCGSREHVGSQHVYTFSRPKLGKPCRSKETAYLGFPQPTMIPCGLLEGHDGRHRYEMSWGATGEPSKGEPGASGLRTRSGPAVNAEPSPPGGGEEGSPAPSPKKEN